jgi:hypothetical protein
MQDLLQDLGIGDQTVPLDHQTLELPQRVVLVGMGLTDQIHRHVRIDENHGW